MKSSVKTKNVLFAVLLALVSLFEKYLCSNVTNNTTVLPTTKENSTKPLTTLQPTPLNTTSRIAANANTSIPHIAMRTIYVFLVSDLDSTMNKVSAISAVAILYFIIRAVCNRRKSRTKRYGILKNNRAAGMEMQPLSDMDDDDDDDLTLFDLSQQRKSTRR